MSELCNGVSHLNSEMVTNFIFEEEPLYYLGGNYCFMRSYYREYSTLSGIIARYYILGDFWKIGGVEYHYLEGKFIKA
jgi:hypothetical protein